MARSERLLKLEDRLLVAQNQADVLAKANPSLRVTKTTPTKLEDRILILQNKADEFAYYAPVLLAKDFDPDQVRDKDGKWSLSGGGGSVLFHGTSSKALGRILRQGLRIGAGGGGGGESRFLRRLTTSLPDLFPSDEGRVYVTKSSKSASAFAWQAAHKKGQPVVLKLSVPKEVASQLPLGPRYRRDNPERLFKFDVKPEWIVGVAHAGSSKPGYSGLARYSFRPITTAMRKVIGGSVTLYIGLVLPDDVIEKDFDPSQPRDPGGKWSAIGRAGSYLAGGFSRAGGLKGKVNDARAAAAWVKSAPAREVIQTVAGSDAVRQGVSLALSALMSYMSHSSNPIAEEVIDMHVKNISANAAVTKQAANEILGKSLRRLRALRAMALRKRRMDEDPLLVHFDKLITAVDAHAARIATEGEVR